MSGNPPRTQTLEALQRANMVRLERARDKARIATAGKAEARELCARVLVDPPAHWRGATAFELLRAIDRAGRHTILRWLAQAGAQESRHLKELTERQRFALADAVRGVERRAAA